MLAEHVYDESACRNYVDFFENAPIGLHIVGPDGLIRRANRAELELLGYADRPGDYVGHHIAEFHADQAVIDDMLNRLVNGKSLIRYQATLKHRLGDTVPVIVYSSPRMWGEQFVNTRCFTYPQELAASPDALWHHARSADVEELTDTARGELFDLLADFFENAPVGLHIVGADGIIKHANRAELAAMGYADEPEAYIGHHIAEFHADQAVIDDMLGRLVSGKPLRSYHARLVRRDRSIFPVTIFSSPRIDDGSFINTRCFTFPRHEESAEKVLRFTWPRNEEGPAPGEAVKGDALTVALRFISGRRRPEESLGFLAELSRELAAGDDHRDTLPRAAALAVPFLGDWCSVDLPDEDLRVLACRGELREREADIRRFLAAPENQPAVHASGEAVCSSCGGAGDDGRALALRALGSKSLILVPLTIGRVVAGSVALLRLGGDEQGSYGPADLALAEEFARRVAAAAELGRLRRRLRDPAPN